jgi:hypothetical protein
VILKKIPFAAVVYIINSGENHSWLHGYGVWASRRSGPIRWVRFLLRLWSFRLLTRTIQETFQL